MLNEHSQYPCKVRITASPDKLKAIGVTKSYSGKVVMATGYMSSNRIVIQHAFWVFNTMITQGGLEPARTRWGHKK